MKESARHRFSTISPARWPDWASSQLHSVAVSVTATLNGGSNADRQFKAW